MKKINLPEQVNYVMSKLRAAGFDAYLVGGSVRDFLIAFHGVDAPKISGGDDVSEPKDFDVTTDATPEEVHAVFTGGDAASDSAHIIDTGIKHGTVTIINDHFPVEVTTYRTEGTYSDGRHPDEVIFSKSIEDDLARRDFTMNAIAYSPDSGAFVDPYNGMVDIDNKLIRCVGNPVDRFSEDALRIMRALRFSSELDFEIEEGTRAALFAEKDRLNNISKERIQKELEGLLCGQAVERVLRDYAEIVAVIIPEIVPMIGLDQCTPYHIYDVWEHSIRVVSGTPATPVLRLAGLFHDIGKPPSFIKGEDGVGHFFGHPEVSYEMADKIMRRLKFDNQTRNQVLTLVRWHDLRPESTDKAVRKTIMKVGPELFDDWIYIKYADNGAQSDLVADRRAQIAEVAEIGHRLIESEGALSLKTIKINGGDLIELGLSQGPEIGKVLNALLSEVLEEKLSNEKDALIARAKKLISDQKII